MFKVVSTFIAPSGMPSPVLWGDEAMVRQRLGHGLSDLRMMKRHYRFAYDFPPVAVVAELSSTALVADGGWHGSEKYNSKTSPQPRRRHGSHST